MSATRSFEAVSLASLRSDAPSCILRIVTYNILADKFATFGFASSPPPSYHTWQHREPRVLLELSSYRADVLCLQEVERPFMEGALGEALTTQGYEASCLQVCLHLTKLAAQIILSSCHWVFRFFMIARCFLASHDNKERIFDCSGNTMVGSENPQTLSEVQKKAFVSHSMLLVLNALDPGKPGDWEMGLMK
jgi:hypothetical protein